MTRRSVQRAQRVLGWTAIGLALAWSLFAQLLWQVETLRNENQQPDVRLVVSALAPIAFVAGEHSDQTPEAPRVAAQPVLPDGEAPAPCQLRRSISTDVEVLTLPETSPYADVPESLEASLGMTGDARRRSAADEPWLSLQRVPACLPRPPPARS